MVNLISKKHSAPHYEVKREELKDLMKEHPKYFKEILEHEEGKKEGKKFKLRNKSVISFSRVLEIIGIRPSAKKHLIKTIKNLNEEATKEKTPDKVKIKKEPKQDLLKLNEEDLKHIKHLKEKIMNPIKTTSTSVVNKKSTQSKTI